MAVRLWFWSRGIAREEGKLVAILSVTIFSLWSMSLRWSGLHELMPCGSIQTVLRCCLQAEIEWAQIVLNRSQPGLPLSTGSASPVFGRTPNAGLKSSRMVLTDVGMTKVARERQAPSTDSIWHEWLNRTRPNHVIGDKVRPVDMENTSEAPIIQCWPILHLL